MNSTAAIFARMAVVAASLETYNGAPAIFSERAPDDFLDTPPVKPFVIIAAPKRDDFAGTFTEDARLVEHNVLIHQRDHGSSASLDAVARTIREAFHNRPTEMSVDGGRVTIVTATGPVASPTVDPALLGRRVLISLEMQRN
ncbi:hypothetical protein D3C71_1374670 [compost metagenome]